MAYITDEKNRELYDLLVNEIKIAKNELTNQITGISGNKRKFFDSISLRQEDRHQEILIELRKGDSLTLAEQHQIRTSHDRIINQINNHIEKVVAREKERQNIFWMNQFKVANTGP